MQNVVNAAGFFAHLMTDLLHVFFFYLHRWYSTLLFLWSTITETEISSTVSICSWYTSENYLESVIRGDKMQSAAYDRLNDWLDAASPLIRDKHGLMTC